MTSEQRHPGHYDGFLRYLKRTIRSLKILDAFRFPTQKNSDVFNFGQNFVRNLKRPKFW